MDHLLAAASAALGRELADPVDLGGSDRSAVLRCGIRHDGGTVVVKRYPRTREGAGSFATEAAALTLIGPAGAGPALLAASAENLLVVMTDLGTAPSLADLLLTGPRAAAERALLNWARACGELAVHCAGREAELASLRAGYRAPPAEPAGRDEHFLGRRLREIPALLAALGLAPPPGLGDDLAEVATILQPGRYAVFSPGDTCPDNNLLTPAGVRFIDFESAGFHSAFLDAAYLRMPFSTCWCVFRLPADLAGAAECAYRALAARVHPPLADDRVWLPGVRRAMAAWTLHAMTYLLDRAMTADRLMIDDGRPAPTARQLLRYRWGWLLAELGSAGELPALRALAERLLGATAHWQVADLPVYPGLR